MPQSPKVITVTLNTAIDRVLVVPGFKAGGHLEAKVVSDSPAGKGVNVAKALARLGRPVTATGFVGKGEAPQFESLLASHENKAPIENQLIPVSGRTRENITIVASEARTDTHLRTQGYEPAADDIIHLTTSLRELSQPGRVVVFTGSLPSGVNDAGLLRLIETVQQRGADVVLDLNGNTLAAVLNSSRQPFSMISPNHTELAETVGHESEIDEQAMLDAARGLRQQAGWLLVSRGRDGAWLLAGSDVYHGVCNVDADRVVNTVSAGDCLLAGVLDTKLQGLPPDQALRQGLAIATASTFHHSPACFEQPDVDALLETVVVTTV